MTWVGKIAVSALVAILLSGCRDCNSRTPDASSEPGTTIDAPTVDPKNEPEDVLMADLPELDRSMLGLADANPSQPALNAQPVIKARQQIMAGDYDEARSTLDEILGDEPEHLEAAFVLAGLLARGETPGEAVDMLATPLTGAFTQYAPRIAEDPGIEQLEKVSDEDHLQLVRMTEATRIAWADTLSSAGAYALVAPAFEDTKLNRGWVVFVDTSTGRFLPVITRTSVAGFLLDRNLKRIYCVTWKSYQRELTDDEAEVIRPAVMMGVELWYVDLDSLQQGGPVGLGNAIVSVRLSARSGLLLAATETLDPGDGEPETSHVQIDWESSTTSPAAEAAPGPMDLVVRYSDISPPGVSPGSEPDTDAIPGGWHCVTPSTDHRLCAVPTASDGVLHELILEDGDDDPATLMSGLGVLQMDVL